MSEASAVTDQMRSASTDFESFVAARSAALWRSAYLLTGDPRGQRAVIVLRFFDDLTEAQTADALS